MPLDPSIPLQTTVANPANMIGGFLDLGLKRNALDLSNATLPAQIARTQAESQVAVGTAGPRIATAQALASGAQSDAQLKQLNLLQSHVANAIQQAGVLVNKPDLSRKDIIGAITDVTMNAGGSNAAIAQEIVGMPQTDDPAALRKFVIQKIASLQSAAGQLGSIAPPPSFINTGQTAQPVASGPEALTGVQPGAPQGVPTQMQPPPTTPVWNPQTKQFEMLGSRLGPGSAGGAGLPTTAPLGVPEGVRGTVEASVKHYQGVQQDASDAPRRIGVLEEIKSLAPQAMTGDANTLKQIVSKLAAYTGWTGELQTPTDVMAKESALLATKSGNTDLSNLLSQAATPNGKMTKGAILRTSDQLIGVELRNRAAQKYFAGTAPDADAYQQKMAAWNSAADPRAFEYAYKSDAERAKMKEELVKSGQWPRFRANLIQLHAMGISP